MVTIKDYKIIKNDRKGDGKEHAEISFIEQIRGLDLEYMMSKMSMNNQKREREPVVRGSCV